MLLQFSSSLFSDRYKYLEFQVQRTRAEILVCSIVDCTFWIFFATYSWLQQGRGCHRRVVLQNDPQIPLCMNCKYGHYGRPVPSSRFMLNCACDHSSTLIGFNTWPENYRFNTFHAFFCYSDITCVTGYLVFREHHTLCTEICDLISSSSSSSALQLCTSPGLP
jgi:hypothetical protein